MSYIILAFCAARCRSISASLSTSDSLLLLLVRCFLEAVSESLLDEETDFDLLLCSQTEINVVNNTIHIITTNLYLESDVSLRLTEGRDEWCFSVFLDRERDRERRLCLLRLTRSRDLDLLLLLDFVMINATIAPTYNGKRLLIEFNQMVSLTVTRDQPNRLIVRHYT